MRASIVPHTPTVQRAKRRGLPPVVVSAALVALVVLYLLPLVMGLVLSFKTSSDLAQNPLGWPRTLTLDNYAAVWQQMNYLRMVGNTVFITAVSTALVALIAPLAAYPLARLQTRWTGLIYGLFIAGLTVPFFMLMIPLQFLMKGLGLINTYTGVILLYATLNLPLAVFFYTSFLRSIPLELEEAAAIDGATPLQTFWFVLMPLLRPVSGTLAMFVTLSVWNDFLLPLVFLYKPEARTIMISVASFVGEYGFDPAKLFPAAVLASLPLVIFFFFVQRQIIAGVAAGAVKG